MTEREILLRKISAADFALVDLHLFLDTHPNNSDIAKKIAEYEQKSLRLRETFEQQYGPLTPLNDDGNRWHWISAPWPWDSPLEEEC